MYIETISFCSSSLVTSLIRCQHCNHLLSRGIQAFANQGTLLGDIIVRVELLLILCSLLTQCCFMLLYVVYTGEAEMFSCF